MKKWLELKQELKRHKKEIIIGSTAFLLAAASIACAITFGALGNKLLSQQAAERFRGDGEARFAQVSAFFPTGSGKKLSDVYDFRRKIEAAIADEALEAPENGSLWVDAYSAESQVSIEGTRGSAASVKAICVGGDWFSFHPLFLESGTYLSEDDLMHDRVIMDETLAWRIFGSTEVTGMDVTINGKPFIVAGIARREDDFATKKAVESLAPKTTNGTESTEDPGFLIMFYDALDSGSESDADAPEINTYEYVFSDPISGFALSLAEKNFTGAMTVQNTDRFTISKAFSVIRDYGGRSMYTLGVSLPYWENAARCIEDICALLLVLAMLTAVFPLICIIWVLVRLGKRAYGKLSEVIPEKFELLSDKVRAKQREHIEKKQSKW